MRSDPPPSRGASRVSQEFRDLRHRRPALDPARAPEGGGAARREPDPRGGRIADLQAQERGDRSGGVSEDRVHLGGSAARALAQQRGPAGALPPALPPHPGGRVPGHQRHPVRLGAHAGGRAGRALRGGRRRPVHLRLARRRRGEHPLLREVLSRGDGAASDAELPVHADDSPRRERSREAQHRAQGEGALDRERGRGAAPRAPGRG